ncbi:probable G-protein coupled receptor 160 [Mugil cephalus]|uniref:probable G-protein coupled receptor 160 n=1 Tax=Mugil cephalus TaxID=48193 RepID=UPI001FB5970D|nr:probable G-protein coupled receptor 160 [Mugil cephalus]XP_047444720.1 probable G-protein coupled receptor 160 [Mugil cephalus]
MYLAITSILPGLGGKCLLNWFLVFLQRNHIYRSFLGVFSISLALVDTALAVVVAALYVCSDGHGVALLGLRLTTYHACLLVQIVAQVHRALQWPVVVMAALDHFSTVSQGLYAGFSTAKWFVYLFLTGFLWYLAALYVFLLSNFIPVFEDVSIQQMHRCWVFYYSPLSLEITVLLLLTVAFAALRASCCLPPKDQITDQSRTHSRRSFVHQVLCIFLKTWTLFLVFLAALTVLPVGLPTYLDLNVAWLCFLNSLLIAVALCAVCPTWQGLAAVPPDRFCEWRFNFSPAAEDKA